MARILIVDDEDNLRLLIKEELEEAGYDVIDASSAKKALEIFKEEDIDLLCTDIEMPDMNGLELAGEIRKKYSETKIILLTAYSHYKSEMASWAADAYVVKSMDLTELKDIIANILKI
ncbi:response regulator [Oceanotoga sp. DSM 15011]|jgi:DNA-binding response OmpR family regulator|uniref:Response regulator receiver domain-containing protein n=1 Tax=Oceanotoga teriensis TaxID=515440 RepID=A0AA45C5U1_9BACT|nr:MULTISPECIES: response regulator [Oceanotoga]MDN5341673.1 hypothetical protein [Oceanotoga sp.]MDO7977427.1 response regulator [Oceanotoga teriensis]PWJ89621.1 response regulator receiver domain-containing protein [Oceanotoga teriensis]UYO98891.1 response regulator [Oceanotoga sp. DSM 15011]